MWADATTLFVVDPVDLLVYAYRLSDGAVQNSREFALLSTNSDPTGIWSDGVTAWVADSADHQLYSYNLALRQPDDDKNIDLDGDNTDPAGVASNGATIWVADPTDQKVYAYALQDGGRVVTKEINTLVNAGNSAPSGMWADQETIWINDAGDSKTYTYNLPPARTPQQVAADATLSALTVSSQEHRQVRPGGHLLRGGRGQHGNGGHGGGNPQRPQRHGIYHSDRLQRRDRGAPGQPVGGPEPGHDQGHLPGRHHPDLPGQHQPGRHRQLRLEGRRRPGRATATGNKQQIQGPRRAQRHLLDLVHRLPNTCGIPAGRVTPPRPRHQTCTAPTTSHHTCGRTGRPSGSATQ